MKRRLLPLAALLCAAVLCMTMAFAAESYTISIDVPAGTLHTGDSFTAGITLHGRAGESAPSTLQVDVIYAGVRLYRCCRDGAGGAGHIRGGTAVHQLSGAESRVR